MQNVNNVGNDNDDRLNKSYDDDNDGSGDADYDDDEIGKRA